MVKISRAGPDTPAAHTPPSHRGLKTGAIILAAGKSQRMGSPKALLPCPEGTFIERIIAMLKRSRADRITTVLGHEAGRIQAGADLSAIRVVINEQYELGQLSSLQAALRSVPDDTDAILMCLVDQPFVKTETVDSLIAAFRRTSAPIVLPTYKGKRGHPVLFARPLFEELLAAPLDIGARHVVRTHSECILDTATSDAGTAITIHTMADYRRHFGAGV